MKLLLCIVGGVVLGIAIGVYGIWWLFKDAVTHAAVAVNLGLSRKAK